jgi:2-oxoglutarate ferredoxin oxidoreductase subunit alpha
MAAGKKRSIPARQLSLEDREEVTIRFAGDAGDGMLLAGAQFISAAAVGGNDINILPDFAAEIRAPAGTLAGVSGLQVRFGQERIHTAGDILNALVAMNPAALRANLPDLEPGGLLVVNADAFSPGELQKAGYAGDPLHDGSLAAYRLLPIPMNKLNLEAIAQLKLSPREADRCKSFFALGLVCWLFDKPLEPTLAWIKDKFAKNPAVLEANSRTLRAGWNHGGSAIWAGDTAPSRLRVAKANLPKGQYRKLTGNEGVVLGLVTAARQANLSLVYAAAPGMPASDLFHQLANLKQHGVFTLQAEDEIAALAMAVGASFGGSLGVTATSGPGMSLSAEGLGLAVMAELPCVVVNLQRGGPSTGLPTKTEQADLLQALFGRHGECPLPVLAPGSAADCFTMAYEAVRLATRYMTPVVLLSDVHLAHSAQAWRIPANGELPDVEVHHPAASRCYGSGVRNQETSVPLLPYERDEQLARPWALPGTPGLEHRVGGLEKEDKTGDVSYDPVAHETLVKIRADKIARIASDIPLLEVHGAAEGELLVLGWGSTQGAILSAVERARAKKRSVACAHLSYLHPLPRNTGDVLRRFKKVLVPELNGGQLLWLLRARFLVDAVGYNKIQGSPFLIREIEAKIEEIFHSGDRR